MLTVSAFASLVAITCAVPVAGAVTVGFKAGAAEAGKIAAFETVHTGVFAVIVAPVASLAVADRSTFEPGVKVLIVAWGVMATEATATGVVVVSPPPPQAVASVASNNA